MNFFNKVKKKNKSSLLNKASHLKYLFKVLEPKIIITKIIIIHLMLHFKIIIIIKWEILHSYSEIALIKIMKIIPIIKKLALWLSLITETETKVFIVLEKEKLNKI
jgi:hypothetical protein